MKTVDIVVDLRVEHLVFFAILRIADDGLLSHFIQHLHHTEPVLVNS